MVRQEIDHFPIQIKMQAGDKTDQFIFEVRDLNVKLTSSDSRDRHFWIFTQKSRWQIKITEFSPLKFFRILTSHAGSSVHQIKLPQQVCPYTWTAVLAADTVEQKDMVKRCRAELHLLRNQPIPPSKPDTLRCSRLSFSITSVEFESNCLSSWLLYMERVEVLSCPSVHPTHFQFATTQFNGKTSPYVPKQGTAFLSEVISIRTLNCFFTSPCRHASGNCLRASAQD